MKLILLLLSVLTLSSCIKTQSECNCDDFKTGNFEFTQDINGKKMVSTFTRTENLQIETFQSKTDTASVRWTNDCEFILQKTNPKNMQEQKAIAMKIIATKDKTYTFEYNFVGDPNKKTGTVTKK
jgi:hypothetical protein